MSSGGRGCTKTIERKNLSSMSMFILSDFCLALMRGDWVKQWHCVKTRYKGTRWFANVKWNYHILVNSSNHSEAW